MKTKTILFVLASLLFAMFVMGCDNGSDDDSVTTVIQPDAVAETLSEGIMATKWTLSAAETIDFSANIVIVSTNAKLAGTYVANSTLLYGSSNTIVRSVRKDGATADVRMTLSYDPTTFALTGYSTTGTDAGSVSGVFKPAATLALETAFKGLTFKGLSEDVVFPGTAGTDVAPAKIKIGTVEYTIRNLTTTTATSVIAVTNKGTLTFALAAKMLTLGNVGYALAADVLPATTGLLVDLLKTKKFSTTGTPDPHTGIFVTNEHAVVTFAADLKTVTIIVGLLANVASVAETYELTLTSPVVATAANTKFAIQVTAPGATSSDPVTPHLVTITYAPGAAIATNLALSNMVITGAPLVGELTATYAMAAQ